MKSILNFIDGIGSIFNIMPTTGEPCIKSVGSDYRDDYTRLAQDWQNIGNDIRSAMNESSKTSRVPK